MSDIVIAMVVIVVLQAVITLILLKLFSEQTYMSTTIDRIYGEIRALKPVPPPESEADWWKSGTEIVSSQNTWGEAPDSEDLDDEELDDEDLTDDEKSDLDRFGSL